MVEYAKKENGEGYEEEDLIYEPLWWHKKGLQQTATGYGKKLITPHMLIHNGRKKRVYCICFSNCGTLYIMNKGNNLYLNL